MCLGLDISTLLHPLHPVLHGVGDHHLEEFGTFCLLSFSSLILMYLLCCMLCWSLWKPCTEYLRTALNQWSVASEQSALYCFQSRWDHCSWKALSAPLYLSRHGQRQSSLDLLMHLLSNCRLHGTWHLCFQPGKEASQCVSSCSHVWVLRARGCCCGALAG